MRCEDVMKRNVQCAAESDTVEKAARTMRDQNIGFLPVCDASNKVMGTITDRDIVIRVLADGKPTTTTIGEVMSREVVSCKPEDELRLAERLLARNKKSRIVCIDESDRLVGVISLSDIAQLEPRDANVGETLRRVTQREAQV